MPCPLVGNTRPACRQATVGRCVRGDVGGDEAPPWGSEGTGGDIPIVAVGSDGRGHPLHPPSPSRDYHYICTPLYTPVHPLWTPVGRLSRVYRGECTDPNTRGDTYNLVLPFASSCIAIYSYECCGLSFRLAEPSKMTARQRCT